MRPALATKNACDASRANPKGVGYRYNLFLLYKSSVANFVNLIRSDFRLSVKLTKRSPNKSVTPFLNHVVHVGLGCPQKKMGWINAWGIVAMVADQKGLSVKRPQVKNVADEMRQNGWLCWISRTKLSVSPIVPAPRPHPTPIRDFNLLPKPPHDCWGKSLRFEKLRSIVWPFEQLHFVRVALPKVTGLAGATCL